LGQRNAAIAIGDYAGSGYDGTPQESFAIAIGASAGDVGQENSCIAIGNMAARGGVSSRRQNMYAIAIGLSAGEFGQGTSSVALGTNAGRGYDGSVYGPQAEFSVAVGSGAGTYSQGDHSVAIGPDTASDTQGDSSVAIGYSAASSAQGNSCVAVGVSSGASNQRFESVAIGSGAGAVNQGQREDPDRSSDPEGFSVAVGSDAGASQQRYAAVALGSAAGYDTQGSASVACGYSAGYLSQGAHSVAIGQRAGFNYLGESAIAIGSNAAAGLTGSVGDNYIVLNATGTALNPAGSSRFYVKPIRSSNILSAETPGDFMPLMYSATSGEIASNSATAAFINYEVISPEIPQFLTDEYSAVISFIQNIVSPPTRFYNGRYTVTLTVRTTAVSTSFPQSLFVSFSVVDSNGSTIASPGDFTALTLITPSTTSGPALTAQSSIVTYFYPGSAPVYPLTIQVCAKSTPVPTGDASQLRIQYGQVTII
jgi:hypothetical protein